MGKFEMIIEIAEKTNGIITSKQIKEAGISRTTVKSYVDNGRLMREGKGIYSVEDTIADAYKVLQLRSGKMIFSYGTALYLWDMSDRIPHYIDVTVPQGNNVTQIKRDNPSVRFHYIKKELWEVGITQVRSPMGNLVNLYDKERCICDVVLMKKEMDKQVYIQAIKEYFKAGYHIMRLIQYAKIFGVEEQIRDYLEILS